MKRKIPKARRLARAALLPPWQEGDVRPEYANGLWSYAVGTTAETHPDYLAAVKKAEREGWSAWWIRSVQDVAATMSDHRMDEARGRAVVDIIQKCMRQTMSRWAGKPFTLFDWQVYDLVVPLFGWVNSKGTRRFRKSINWTPKKQGKSNIAAAIGNYMLVADREYSPEIYCSATSRQQAGIIHKVARDIVKVSPALAKRVTLYETQARMVCPGNNGIFQALSSETKGSEGLNWHMWMCDEVHVNARPLVEALERGGIAREQSLLFAISTAGVFDPYSIGWQYWEHSQHIYDGSILDPKVHTLVYAAPPDCDWLDPAMHKYANPSLDLVTSASDMMQEAQNAKAIPQTLNSFKRYRLNIWVQSAERWLDYDRWIARGTKKPAPCRMVDGELVLSDYAKKLVGRRCYGGFDLSTTTDMTACALWFPGDDGKPAHNLTMFWVPGDDLVNLAHNAKAPYGQWRDDGWLHVTDGDRVDYQALRKFLLAASDVFDLIDVGYDRFNATSIVSDLISDGFTMVQHPQGFGGQSPPIKEMESLLANPNALEHENHPILNWNVSGAQAWSNTNGDKRLVKMHKQRRYHIDGLCANLTALWRHINTPDDGPSVYETRGIMTI